MQICTAINAYNKYECVVTGYVRFLQDVAANDQSEEINRKDFNLYKVYTKTDQTYTKHIHKKVLYVNVTVTSASCEKSKCFCDSHSKNNLESPKRNYSLGRLSPPPFC